MTDEQQSLFPDEPLELGEVEQISLAMIDPPTGPAPDASFVESVRALGVLQPVYLEQLTPTRYAVVSGRRRVMAANLAELGAVPAFVLPSKRLAVNGLAATLTLIENHQRKANPWAELNAIRSLLDRGFSEKEIARQTGMALGLVRKRLKLCNLEEEFLDGLALGKIKPSQAERIASLPKTRQHELLERMKAADGKLTHEDIDAVRRVTVKAATQSLPDEAFTTGGSQEGAEAKPTGLNPVVEAELRRVAALARKAGFALQGWQEAAGEAWEEVA